MTNEHWTDRLSDYLDGELESPERAACEAHLERCASCGATLDELHAVVAEAALLPDIPPARDLWPGIEGRLEPRDATAVSASVGTRPQTRVFTFPTRRVSLSIPQLAAAAIALVLISAGSVLLMLPGSQAPTLVAGTTAADGSAVPVALTTRYDDTIRNLEAEFDSRRATLDPETIRVVESNLAIIDTAIAEAAAALEQDPSSAFLNTHLASVMRQKVQLLRQAATMEPTEI